MVRWFWRVWISAGVRVVMSSSSTAIRRSKRVVGLVGKRIWPVCRYFMMGCRVSVDMLGLWRGLS